MNEKAQVMEKIDKLEENEIKSVKSYEIPETLARWILHLKEKLYKRCYKKVIKDITSIGLINKYRDTPGGYKILIIYIRAKIKIIENKIFKYHLNQIENPKQKYQMAHCFNYAQNLQKDLMNLIEEISDNNKYDNAYYNNIDKRNYKIELFDDIIRCHFDYIYIMSLLHFKAGNLIESVSYLSLFLNMYKETKLFILSTHTLNKIEKCFILLTKIYIDDEDYENAITCVNEGIKICFQHILFQVQELYYGVFVGNKQDLIVREKEDLLYLKDSRIKGATLNIILLFLYEGICNENMANIKKASAYFKQSEWFAKTFCQNNSNKSIYKLFYNIKRKSIEVSNIVDFFKEKIEESELRFKKKDENKYKKISKFSLKKADFLDMSKFKNLIDKLDGLKIKEIDTVNIFERNKSIKTLNESKREGYDKKTFLSNIRLLEAYLKIDFKNIVINMDKIKLFDFDYKTRGIVQKNMYKLFYEESQRENKNKNRNKTLKINYSSNCENEEKKNINDNVGDNRNISNNSFLVSSLNMENKRNKKNKIISINLNKFNSPKRLVSPKMRYLNNNIIDNDNIINISTKKMRNTSLNSINENKPLEYNKIKFMSSRLKKMLNSTSSHSILNASLPLKNGKISSVRSKSTEKQNEDKEKSPISLKNYKHKGSNFSIWHWEAQKSDDFFNLKYLKRREYIKKLEDRELIFQKLILKSKQKPYSSIQLFNKVIAKQNANNSFSKIESLISNRSFNDWKENTNEEDYKNSLIINKLEQTMLSSLNNRALYNYKMNKRSLAKREERKDVLNNFYKKKNNNVDIKNKNTLSELNSKLDLIYNSEQKRKKEMEEHEKEIQKNIFKKFRIASSKTSFFNIKFRPNFNKLLNSKSLLSLSKLSLNESN